VGNFFYKANRVISDKTFIPRHGHSIIAIVEVTNAMGGPNTMVNYNISHGS
jgi:hypothetical protein